MVLNRSDTDCWGERGMLACVTLCFAYDDLTSAITMVT